jgi:hypothetical protein
MALKSLQGLIPSLATSFEKIYMVVDGIDECENAERSALLKLLKDLTGLEACHVRVLATSRPHIPDIQQAFQLASKVTLRAREEDLEDFVKSQLHEDEELLSLVRSKEEDGSETEDEDPLEETIVKSTVSKASGM